MTDAPAPDDVAMWKAYNDFHFLCDTARFQKLFARLEMVRLVAERPGDIVDAGAFKGVSTIQFAHLLATYQPLGRAKVIAFDTFEDAFPALRPEEAEAAAHLMAAHEDNAHESLCAAVVRLGLGERVEIVRGDIAETLPRYIAERPGFRISLLHCDLDAYAPTLATLEAAWPRVVPGGVVVFDEYAVAGWGESDAADEFFATLEDPPRLRVLPHTATPTAYCVKAAG